MNDQLYVVEEKYADDPESNYSALLNTDQISERYPELSLLIYGDGTESIDYTHELVRIRIYPKEFEA